MDKHFPSIFRAPRGSLWPWRSQIWHIGCDGASIQEYEAIDPPSVLSFLIGCFRNWRLSGLYTLTPSDKAGQLWSKLFSKSRGSPIFDILIDGLWWAERRQHGVDRTRTFRWAGLQVIAFLKLQVLAICTKIDQMTWNLVFELYFGHRLITISPNSVDLLER